MQKNSISAVAGQGEILEISSPCRLVLVKSGNLLELSPDGISPLPSEVRSLLEPQLRYTKKIFLYGADRYDPLTGSRDRRVKMVPKQCYKYDALGRLITNFGFARRLLDELIRAGYQVDVRNVDPPPPRSDVYDFSWEAVRRHFSFRARQEECLGRIATSPCGVVHAVTGFGKLVQIAMSCLGFRNAKIDVTTRRVALVNKISDYLTRYIPNVGQIGGGKNSKGERVTVYTAASLNHSDFDADIVLVDEAHELTADKSSEQLARYQRARMFAFSASPIGRLDGADLRMEMLFGNTIFHLPYAEAAGLGLVVPIRVEWSDVILPSNPCANQTDVARKRWGIWRNEARNRIIAERALSFGPDDQVLICVETIEHAVYLWRHLREAGYVLVYNEMDEGDLRRYKRDRLLPEDFPEMTPQLKEEYRVAFEAGRLKRAISTLWDVGIDPCQLTALIRADGADSQIDDVQAPGRVCRTHAVSGKEVGIVCDFRDQFDASLAKRAKNREERYAAVGWDQVAVRSDGSCSPLRQRR